MKVIRYIGPLRSVWAKGILFTRGESHPLPLKLANELLRSSEFEVADLLPSRAEPQAEPVLEDVLDEPFEGLLLLTEPDLLD